MSIFNVTYNITSSSSYRIILSAAKKSVYINQIFKVKTITRNQSFFSTTGSIFMDTNF
jgi:hypothetical protein